MIRVLADDISVMGRSTQGVKTMKMSENDQVVALARVAHRDEDENLL
jgi:DNA gyrase/topoisomerase IV subunit A